MKNILITLAVFIYTATLVVAGGGLILASKIDRKEAFKWGGKTVACLQVE
jgi:hypothetical protein